MTPDDNQAKLHAYLTNSDNINKAVEGSMDKRLKSMPDDRSGERPVIDLLQILSVDRMQPTTNRLDLIKEIMDYFAKKQQAEIEAQVTAAVSLYELTLLRELEYHSEHGNNTRARHIANCLAHLRSRGDAGE